MASDSGYDGFNYRSSQDSCEIDYQIDLFEFRQDFKFKKQTKQKLNKSSCPVSVKTLKSQATLVKTNSMSYKTTPKAERKSFRYDHYPPKAEIFECDEQFQVKPTSTPSNPSKQLDTDHLDNFPNFRRHFYHINHQRIKSSLQDYPNIEITDIRLAPVNEIVQKDFMTTLNKNTSYFPHLVYHGTKLTNIESVLRYGFLIPNRAHPTNSEAPMIVSAHGRSYGTGIYSSQTAIYSLSYLNTTNTLLVCAAIPPRDKLGKVQRSFGNILVLSREAQIIPLFFMDFRYLKLSNTNYPWFNQPKKLKTEKNKEVKKPVVISRKYLRKVLNMINDQERKNKQYQVRMFDSFN